MKKTKIICTMGPNSDDREVMKQLLLNGMDVARFNFSHGTHDEQRARYKQQARRSSLQQRISSVTQRESTSTTMA